MFNALKKIKYTFFVSIPTEYGAKKPGIEPNVFAMLKTIPE